MGWPAMVSPPSKARSVQAQEKNDYPVLFVDDEPILVKTFVNNFEDSFQVLTAEGGREALDLLRAREVAVMVTDQRMPGMHGLEVIREGLKVRPDLVPIILTGFTNDADLI